MGSGIQIPDPYSQHWFFLFTLMKVKPTTFLRQCVQPKIFRRAKIRSHYFMFLPYIVVWALLQVFI